MYFLERIWAVVDQGFDEIHVVRARTAQRLHALGWGPHSPNDYSRTPPWSIDPRLAGLHARNTQDGANGRGAQDQPLHYGARAPYVSTHAAATSALPAEHALLAPRTPEEYRRQLALARERSLADAPAVLTHGAAPRVRREQAERRAERNALEPRTYDEAQRHYELALWLSRADASHARTPATAHAPATHDFRAARERTTQFFSAIERSNAKLRARHGGALNQERERDWSPSSLPPGIAQCYSGPDGARLLAQETSALRSASHQIREVIGATGMVSVENDGKTGERKNNCLLIALLQHATGNYGSEHPEEVMRYRNMLAHAEHDGIPLDRTLSPRQKAIRTLVDRVNADRRLSPPLRVTFVSELDGEISFDHLGSSAPDARTVVIWDQGGHFEAIAAPELLPA